MFTGDQIVERATALKARFGLATPDEDVQQFSKSLLKGMLAGMVGGLAGTAAKTIAEKVYPPRIHGEPEPPSVLADKITGGQLEGTEKVVATEGDPLGIRCADGSGVRRAGGVLSGGDGEGRRELWTDAGGLDASIGAAGDRTVGGAATPEPARADE